MVRRRELNPGRAPTVSGASRIHVARPENVVMRAYDIPSQFGRSGSDDGGLDALLHPAQAFEHPMSVVNDPDLTLSEKRAILASWASDICAVGAAPALRRVPGTGKAVAFDDVMDALRNLDRLAGGERRPHYRRVLENRRPGVFGRKSPPSGTTLN
jgi:hypothetical protein